MEAGILSVENMPHKYSSGLWSGIFSREMLKSCSMTAGEASHLLLQDHLQIPPKVLVVCTSITEECQSFLQLYLFPSHLPNTQI